MGHLSFFIITDLKITAEAVEILSINYASFYFILFSAGKNRPPNNKASEN